MVLYSLDLTSLTPELYFVNVYFPSVLCPARTTLQHHMKTRTLHTVTPTDIASNEKINASFADTRPRTRDTSVLKNSETALPGLDLPVSKLNVEPEVLHSVDPLVRRPESHKYHRRRHHSWQVSHFEGL